MSGFSPPTPPPKGRESLLIVGASARAAAESARRAGYNPYAIDLFADADLAEVAEVQVSRNFPCDIPSLARRVPACDWLYVGGMENYPEVVDELTADRHLLGCSGALLRRVRDPRLLRDELCRHGVMTPESIFDRAELRRRLAGDAASPVETGERAEARPPGEWLVKRRRSSAGLGVEPWTGRRLIHTSEQLFDGDRYLQRRVAGESIGAVYLASRSRTDFLGASYQLTCPSRDGKHPFRYAGSVGPLWLERLEQGALVDKLRKIGSVVTSVYPLSGIFSLDFLLDAGNEIRLLEVNPRYTAGCEILEQSFGKSLIGLHAEACRGELTMESRELVSSFSQRRRGFSGKKVVYAVSDVAQVSEDMTRTLLTRRFDDAKFDRFATICDIPRAGAVIRCDEPVATVFATGDDEQTVRERLDRRERELRAIVGC